jgi:phospholipid/cholesterol/gamma-HCH transport system substrate-binding protein
MSERNKQFRVGVVAIATVVITAILVAWHSDFSALPFREQYDVQMLVDQAPGVGPNTPVRRRGLLVGRVANVEATDDGALITISLDRGKEIKSNEEGRIQSSLIGDAVIEFVPVKSPAGAQAVPPGGRVQGSYNPTPLDMLAEIQGDLRQTVVSLGSAGDQVAQLAGRLNKVLEENDLERVTRLVESLETAVAEFKSVMRNVNDVIGDEQVKAQLQKGLEQLPTLLSDARGILEALQGAVVSADANLKNLQGLTGPLGERGPAIVDVLEKSVRNLEALLGQVAEFTRKVNQSEGTVGLLLRDRQLYDQVLAAVEQASGTIRDVRTIVANVDALSRRVRPILDDVRVFTDKIARDPARIARGVIDRETPIK